MPGHLVQVPFNDKSRTFKEVRKWCLLGFTTFPGKSLISYSMCYVYPNANNVKTLQIQDHQCLGLISDSIFSPGQCLELMILHNLSLYTLPTLFFNQMSKIYSRTCHFSHIHISFLNLQMWIPDKTILHKFQYKEKTYHLSTKINQVTHKREYTLHVAMHESVFLTVWPCSPNIIA